MAYDKTQQRRMSAGLCKDCGKERGTEGTTVFCRPCAKKISLRSSAKRKADREKWTALGLCYGCGKVRQEKTSLCALCKARSRDGYHKAKDERKKNKEAISECRECKAGRAGSSNLCLNYWIKRIARSGFVGREKDLLAILDKQEWKCFYTGQDLIAGQNASLDHLFPRLTHPEKMSDIQNVVWADRDINLMKGARSYDEFISLCGKIFNSKIH